MKKLNRLQFIAGFALGAMIFGGSVAFAAGVMAQPKTAAVVIDGKNVDLMGYIIEGSHYFQLRDLDEKLKPSGKDFSVVWDGKGNRIIIDTSRGYDPAELYVPSAGQTPAPATGSDVRYTQGQTKADGSGSISDTKLNEKIVDGKDSAREDFSQMANPAAFGGKYSRGMYNAAYQTWTDKECILPLNDSSNFNPYYSYASAVDSKHDGSNYFEAPLTDISRMYSLSRNAEPYTKNQWKHPGYFIVTVRAVNYTVDQATLDILEAAKPMPDRDKIISLNRYVHMRITYEINRAAGIEQVFTASEPVKGACGTFASAFLYLCERAGIPCIMVSGDGHAWTMAYVNGKWLHCDVTNSRYTNDGLLRESIRFKPYDPQRVMFAQELLVPGSSK